MRGGQTVLTLFFLAAGPAAGQVVINEIEYDQSGTDTRDFVELYEPAKTGMSLAGWELIMYDGAASERQPYLTIELGTAPGGVMPADGYLVIGPAGVVFNVDIPSPSGGWIQGGSPDGMALVHNGVVVQLLAYEGSFVGNTDGNGGPAAGMTFPDIGVADGGDDGLQRLPDGGTWTVLPQTAATPGAANPAYWGVLAYGKVALMQRTDADSGPIALCADDGTPPYTFTITALPSHGTLRHATGVITTTPTAVNGTLTYVPNAGFGGVDAFDFTARDGGGQVSPAATQELGVQWQIDGVVIAEVMHFPSGDPSIYEYVEVYNATPFTVNLGRLDAAPPLSSNTVGNLLNHSIPAGTARIIAPDARAEGYSLDLFRCEWGLWEAEIIRIPSEHWELLFSAPQAGACSASDGSRLLLLDAAGNLLDAVDLSAAGLAAPVIGQSLTIHDQLLVPPGGPLTTQNNDVPDPWVNAGTPGAPGIRTSIHGDRGGPMFVPSFSTGPYTPLECTGPCCLSGGECQVLTYAACTSAGGNPDLWAPGAACPLGPADFHAFQNCLAGPNLTPPPGCSIQDFDADSDVDLADFAAFQRAFADAPCP